MKLLGRRAIEVATNTIVMVLIAVVVLGLSLSLTYNVFCAAEDYQRTISGQQQQEINRLLTSGGKVVVPDNAQDARVEGSFMCGSSRTQEVEFVLGVQNRGATTDQFFVNIEQVNAPNGYTPGPDDILSFENQETITVLNGETYMTSFLINLPLNAPEGQYQYSVRIHSGSGIDADLYGAQVVYVTVR